MPTLRVAVIGAGPSGLTAAKTCLESGLEPVIFEQSDALGGLWYFDEKVCHEGQPSVMRSTVINSSKELTAFSDFPPPAHFPNYMHHSMLLLYLRMYADHFGVTQRIRTRHAVRDVRLTKDHDRTGRWLVTVEDLSSNQTSRSVFDAVMVCVGHHAYPHRPPLPGLEHFRGRVQHTHAVKDCDRFKGRRLLVVGTGNSGMDVATEASLFAHKQDVGCPEDLLKIFFRFLSVSKGVYGPSYLRLTKTQEAALIVLDRKTMRVIHPG
ncbi:hypothetical protein HPB47_027179 [Ixodes persulcatus]|uniref:Uncharacterized protein n=1 Tax=Ixodes persulcatus TaxID=34615 RepID=A0AC60PWZ8_IXOPE|nr:hypothetical protein HPB47_027179 [Ixodes persulcatus]